MVTAMSAALAPALPAQPPRSPPLPRLRRELRLHEGPRLHDGSPSWTLEDPVRGQYFRLGWAEIEMLARWSLGSAAAVANAVTRETTLALAEGDVAGFARFLHALQLVEAETEADSNRLFDLARARRVGWARWLLHNYLFFRIPLLRPDRFLARTLPWVRPLASRPFILATILAALAGIGLAARQWDAFLHTFLYFFTLEGAALAGLTLCFVKIVHEFGHAYVCKHHGCRVPTMGVALLVMWPVLYTDTTAAWRLPGRRQRLAIGAAGMAAELTVAAWATLAWNFLPDGMMRSAAFTLATTTWILTLAVNLSPLLRFDGYFLLSDLLDLPNLQQRSFALARWRLRQTLFGLPDAPPERFQPWLHRILLLYAYATWIYRFFLFLGIALLVYHFAFKLLGIALFAVEIVCFILMPILRELREWWKGRDRVRLDRHSALSVLALALALALALLPWQGRVEAPALLRAERQAGLFMPVGGQILSIAARPGQKVEQGALLFQVRAPEQEHALAQLDREIALLRERSRFQRRDGEDAAYQQIARRELSAAIERRAALAEQLGQLRITAPFEARVADLATPLAEGEWLPQGEWLATLTGPAGAQVEAFVAEHDLDRLRPGRTAWFIPEDPASSRIELVVLDIAGTATRRLDSASELASPYQGGIAAHVEQNRTLVPAGAIYRITLRPSAKGGASPPQAVRGVVHIDADAQSPLVRAWRAALAALARETAF